MLFSVQTAPDSGSLTPCVNLEELCLGYGFIDIPGAFICCILNPIPSGTLCHLTIGFPDRGWTKGAAWEALDEALVRSWSRQEIGGQLVVELSTPLPAGEVEGRLPRFRDQGLLSVGHRGRPSSW